MSFRVSASVLDSVSVIVNGTVNVFPLGYLATIHQRVLTWKGPRVHHRSPRVLYKEVHCGCFPGTPL